MSRRATKSSAGRSRRKAGSPGSQSCRRSHACEGEGDTAMIRDRFSRRGFLAGVAASACPVALQAQSKKHIPVGLLIYAVLADWKKDFDGTLKAVAQMGYEGVELTQYESWTPVRAKEVRRLLDRIKLKVLATHTEPGFFVPGDKINAAIE